MKKSLIALTALVAVVSPTLAADHLEPLAWFASTHSFASFAIWNGYIFAQSQDGALEIMVTSVDERRTRLYCPSATIFSTLSIVHYQLSILH